MAESERTPSPFGAARNDGLSVVIPAYDEAGNLESLIVYALAQLTGLMAPFEILIVNDGSRDATGVIADRLAVNDSAVRVFHHARNLGFGAAVKTGIANARRAWVAVVPADHQFDVGDLTKMLAARDGSDIVCAYRLSRQDTRRRRLVSRLYNWYVGRAHGIRYRDLNWVKMFRRDIFSRIHIQSTGFCVDIEILLKARALGYRIVELPVAHHARAWGKPTPISIGNVYRTMRELSRIRSLIAQVERPTPPDA